MFIMNILNKLMIPATVSCSEDIKKIKLKDSLNQNILVFKLFGYWPPPKSSKYFPLYVVYCVWMVISVLLMWNITQFVQFYYIMDDLEQVAATLYVLTCTGLEIIKLYYFLKNVYNLSDVVNNLDREIFTPKTPEEYKIVAAILRYAQLTYIVFRVFAVITIFFWGTYPVYDSGEIRRLPFPACFPWDTKKSPLYELTYIYQVFGAAYLGWLNITVDTAASGLMSNINAQLELICYKLVHLHEYSKIKLQKLNAGMGTEIPNEMIHEEMYKQLTECILHHKNILQLAEGVGKVFNISVFYQFFVSAAIICMAMFRLTLVQHFSFEFFCLMFYQICIFMEILMYCWFGNEVILTSRKVVLAAYSCGWIDCSPNFKKTLIYFMTRLQIPLRLYAGGFFVLSIETFTLIVRSAWTYFAVLRQIHSRNE